MPHTFDFHLRQGCASYFFSGPVAKLAFMKIEILKKLGNAKKQKCTNAASIHTYCNFLKNQLGGLRS